VAREGQGTWQYIRDKVQAIRSTELNLGMDGGSGEPDLASKRKKLVSSVRARQNLMAEIEFEWLRQWFVQGQKHASLHPYWHQPMNLLCDAFGELERETTRVINLLKKSSKDGQGTSDATEDLFDILIESFAELTSKRNTWKERYEDTIFNDLPEDERPFTCPCLDRTSHKDDQLPEDLSSLVDSLRKWRAAFVAGGSAKESRSEKGSESGMKKSKKSSKKSKSSGSMTKKESKQRASNWERMKAKFKS